MDIRAQVKEQIDRLMQQSGPAAVSSDSHGAFVVPLEGGQLRLEFVELQPLGCAVWQLDVRTDQTLHASAEQLNARGQELADRAGYLLEPLQVHEVDQQTASVQLRSSPPQRQARTVSYYEVTAQHDGAWRLVRYLKTPGQPRQQVAAVLTVEVLQRLCQDVVDVASA